MVIRSTPAAILFAIEFVDIKFPFTNCIAEQYQQLINRFLERKCSFVQKSHANIHTLTHAYSVSQIHIERAEQQLNYANINEMLQSTNVCIVNIVTKTQTPP